jgi:glycerol transport system ATP-binding protein
LATARAGRGLCCDLPDGTYQAGFRANHLHLTSTATGHPFDCKLAVTEITGSETFIHVDHGADRWVGLVEGVHNLTPGQELTVWLDPAHVYLFDADGRLAAPASYARRPDHGTDHAEKPRPQLLSQPNPTRITR